MRSLLLDNLGLKLVSLLLGGTLWYTVAREQGAERVLTVPLELRNVPEGFEVIEESTQQVDVRVRGSAELVRGLSPQDLQVRVDLSNTAAGEHVIHLNVGNVLVPLGVRIIRVTPASVELQLDRTAERTVQVVPRVTGSPAEGFELTNIRIDPPQLQVIGPESHVNGLEQITTESISVEGLREPYTQPAQVRIEDPYVRLTGASGVDVTLEVTEERLRRRLDGVAVSTRPDSVKSRLSPAAVKVTVEGPRSLVEQLGQDDLRAEVSVEGLQPGSYRLNPEVIFHGMNLTGIEIISIEPAQVRVRISASSAGTMD